MGTLLIPGICAVISEKPLEIRSAVFMRDTIFFLLSLMGLVIFIVDGTIYGLEAIYLPVSAGQAILPLQPRGVC